VTPSPSGSSSRKLTLADIVDLRAYERDRHEQRPQILERKRRRRVALGPMISVTFENRITMRYQIQEMARVERLITDQAIQDQLDAYNPMVPEPGQLSATLFVELTSEGEVREWLPKLVGIEHRVVVRLADDSEVRSMPEAAHRDRLTRPDVTAAVHYVTFEFTPEQVGVFDGHVRLAIDHQAYRCEVDLPSETIAELRADLLPDRH
jgi:hypothetical protein